jgi:phage terminase large subunit-like protein
VAFADVAILAASRDQAGKLLQQLTGYIKRSPQLREQLRITQRIVHCDRTNGKVAVMAADSDTLDGWGGTLALVDELGRHKSEENFGLLRDGLGPRDGQLIAFSTAGDREDTALGRIRARAREMPGFAADPENAKHKTARADGFAFHEWSLDPGDDTDDLALVALANPASWLDEAELRSRKASPSPGDGGSISVEDMVEACLSLARRYPDCTFSFDPKAGGEQLLQRLERELPDSFEFVEFLR